MLCGFFYYQCEQTSTHCRNEALKALEWTRTGQRKQGIPPEVWAKQIGMDVMQGGILAEWDNT